MNNPDYLYPAKALSHYITEGTRLYHGIPKESPILGWICIYSQHRPDSSKSNVRESAFCNPERTTSCVVRTIFFPRMELSHYTTIDVSFLSGLAPKPSPVPAWMK